MVIGTNNQEQGVDESDLVKTDGRRIVSIVNGTLRVVQLDGTPAIDGVLDVSDRGATELFLRDDTALVLGTIYGNGAYGQYGPSSGSSRGVIEEPIANEMEDAGSGSTTTPSTTTPSTTTPSTTTTVTGPTTTNTTTPSSTTTSTTTPTTTSTSTTVPIAPPPFAVATTLTLVDLSDASAPRILSSADVEGSMVTARQIGGRARVVVQNAPVAIEDLYAAASRDEATAAVRSLAGEDLLPRVSVDGSVSDLGSCADVMVAESAPASTGGRANTWSGDPASSISTVTVVTVGDDLADLLPVSVQGAAETVYASTDSLFVAAGSWDESGARTDVHRFDLDSDGPASYTGSGRAPGRLLSQFSLSERDGALRVVTTLDGSERRIPIEGITDDPGTTVVDDAPLGVSSTRLTVLDTDGTLDEIGHLDGMGIGEQVQSVRFVDDVAYVVTFRQVDPLYAIDLSDPRSPTMLGQLKIPGFSEYLHPVGDGLLLGVGRQVDPDSGVDAGLKVSLFDVSDPLQMTEVDQIVVPDAWSAVSDDHRAFTWDSARRRAIIPVERECVMGSMEDMEGMDDMVLGGPATAPPVDTFPTRRVACTPSGAAAVIQVDRSALRQVAEIAHSAASTGGAIIAPMRSSIVDDDVWTLSTLGIGRSDADAPSGVDLLLF